MCSLGSSTSPPLSVSLLSKTFSFSSSHLSFPRWAWLASLSSLIHHHQNSVSISFCCKRWTFSMKVTSIHCAQRLIAVMFLPEWPHRVQLFKEMPEKVFHLPKHLVLSCSHTHVICQSLSRYVTLALHSDLRPLPTIRQSPTRSPRRVQHNFLATLKVSCSPACRFIKCLQTGYWSRHRGEFSAVQGFSAPAELEEGLSLIVVSFKTTMQTRRIKLTVHPFF